MVRDKLRITQSPYTHMLSPNYKYKYRSNYHKSKNYGSPKSIANINLNPQSAIEMLDGVAELGGIERGNRNNYRKRRDEVSQ